MLRPTRRPVRALSALIATIVALTSVIPAVAAPAGPTAAETARADARAERNPTVVGRGRTSVAEALRRGPAPRLQTSDEVRRGAPTSSRAALPGSADGDVTIAAAPVPGQVTSSGAPAPTSLGWGGLNQASSGFEPPDPWVAAGPNHVVQTVNTIIRFTNREGTAVAGDVSVFNFFNLGDFEVGGVPVSIDGVADPRWIYDAAHERWLGLTLAWDCSTAGSDGYLFLAISNGANPAGGYYHLYVRYPGFLPDYPALGTSSDKITMAANEYALPSTSTCTSGLAYDGASLTTFDWNQLLLEPTSPDFHYWLDLVDAGATLFTLRPSVAPLGTPSTIFVVGELPTSQTESDVVYLKVSGTNAGDNITVTDPINLTTTGSAAAFEEPPTPIDPGGPVASGGGVSAVDRRPTDAIWQDSILTFPSTYPCVPAGSVDVRACARITQVDTSTTVPTPVQDMLIASPNRDSWYPGVGQSQTGTLHVVYTRSGATEGMTSIARYQLPTDAENEMSSAVGLGSGGSVAYDGSRWGDFVGVAQDPRDTNAVWQGNQYTGPDGGWRTRVSELQTPGAVFVPITPVRLLDSRPAYNIGLSGAFQANVARTVDIAGRAGIPANALAVTGNLTVVNQTAGGYAVVTPTPDNNPPTSSINFPAGDTRANNVTTTLGGPGGGISLVYKAPNGRTTHLIFDVTGYFLSGNAGQTYNVLTSAGVPAPRRVLDTRPAYNIGLTGSFPANLNREFQVAGVQGIPSDAKAVTANLTVTGQNAAGYVSLATTAPPPVPATSTINFPLGDTRANGLTIKLSPTGTLWAVYKAPPGRAAHLILDVTGYYKDDLNGLRFVPLTPGRRMDTRVVPAPAEGLSGPFAANTPRALIIEPYEGVPANAQAITGNLTVVGQTRAGYVSMTAAATNNPSTSTINFPLGDVRANGVTGPLTAGRSVGLVYKASGGLTHLILDLSGYFR